MEKGMLVVVSGFSGAGKGTIMKRITEKYDNYALSISATTRRPREGEEEGKSYFFVSKARFEEMIDKDELVEYAKYVDNYYGTPRKFVEDCLNRGKDVILEIEIQEISGKSSDFYDTAFGGGASQQTDRQKYGR